MKYKSMVLVFVVSMVLTLFMFFPYTPNILMAKLEFDAQTNGTHGQLVLHPQAQAGEDKIVRMSPDLLYSSCQFDLDKGAYQITSPIYDDYLSLSIFASNSDNIFAVNDLQSPNGFNVVLAKKGSEINVPDGATLVETNSSFGLILFRYYLGKKIVSELDKQREQANCTLLTSS